LLDPLLNGVGCSYCDLGRSPDWASAFVLALKDSPKCEWINNDPVRRAERERRTLEVLN